MHPPISSHHTRETNHSKPPTITMLNESFIQSKDLNLLKAIAIVMVAIDHNDALRSFAPSLFPSMTFHVIAFLYASHYATSKNQSSTRDFITDRTSRYIKPYLLFYCLFALASLTAGASINPKDFIAGLALGSFDAIKKGCGTYILWFLPALITFAVLDKLAQRSSTGIKILLWSCIIATGLKLPELLNVDLSKLKIWGFGPACYALLCCKAVDMTIKMMVTSNPNPPKFTSIKHLSIYSLATLLQWNQIQNGKIIEVGAYIIPNITTPLELLSTLASDTFSVVALVLIGRHASHTWIGTLGSHTLQIFLLHQFFLAPMLMISSKLGLMQDKPGALGLATSIASIIIPIYISTLMKKHTSSIYGLIFGNHRQK